MNEFKLGNGASRHWSAIPLAIVGSVLFFVILSVVAINILQLPLGFTDGSA